MTPIETIANKYIEFVQMRTVGRITEIWQVHNISSGALLGRIKWYPQWRQYCFFPEPETLFNMNCLRAINVKIGILNGEHKKGGKLK
jgi:hypothetical protein